MGYYSLTYKRNLLKKKSTYSLSMSIKGSKPLKEKTRLCLVTVFVFYFQKLVFENIKKKQFSCIFEIKNIFG